MWMQAGSTTATNCEQLPERAVLVPPCTHTHTHTTFVAQVCFESFHNMHRQQRWSWCIHHCMDHVPLMFLIFKPASAGHRCDIDYFVGLAALVHPQVAMTRPYIDSLQPCQSLVDSCLDCCPFKGRIHPWNARFVTVSTPIPHFGS